MTLLEHLVKMCKKYLGEEETNKIIDESIEEFKKENELWEIQ